MASKKTIDSFLSYRRIPVLGVPRGPKDFSRGVFGAFVEPGIEVAEGECPFMFLPDAGWFHGVHRFLRRLGGRLPS